MISEEIKQLLSAYIDGQLEGKKSAEVEELLEASEEARQYYNRLLDLGKMADGLEMQANEGYWQEQKDKIISRIEEAEKQAITTLRVTRYKGLIYKLAAVAASIALVAFISIYESQQIESTQGIFFRENAPYLSVKKSPEGATGDKGERHRQSAVALKSIEAGPARDVKPEAEDAFGITDTQTESDKKSPDVAIPTPVSDDDFSEIKGTDEGRDKQSQPGPAVVSDKEDIDMKSESPRSGKAEKAEFGALPVETPEKSGVRSSAPRIEKPLAKAEEAYEDTQYLSIIDWQSESEIQGEGATLQSVANQVARFTDRALPSEELGEIVIDISDSAHASDYAFWRAGFDSLEAEYGQLLSPHYWEMESKSRREISPDSLSSIVLQLAGICYKVGLLTESKEERAVMKTKLEILSGNADDESRQKIGAYLRQLDSLLEK